MKGLLYLRTHCDDPVNSGVIRKYEAYGRALSNSRIETLAIWYCNQGIKVGDRLIPLFGGRNDKKSFRHILTFLWAGDMAVLQNIDFQLYDFILVRHMPVHPVFLWFLFRIKQANPALKILIELPTWPYDAEMKKGASIAALLLDKLLRRQLHRWVDRVLHYGIEKTIWKIPAIEVRNGADVARVPLSKAPFDAGLIRMIFIGNLSLWHGLDRILHGMKRHIAENGGAPGLHLKIVGGGPEKGRISSLAAELGLGEAIFWIPPCSGAELAALIAQSDVGIGTLGMHRKGVANDSSLKHREYCAHGLPFVFAGVDSDFPSDYPFALCVAPDETPISMRLIVDFLTRIGEQHTDSGQKIRQYAQERLDWSKQVNPVLAYLTKGL